MIYVVRIEQTVVKELEFDVEDLDQLKEKTDLAVAEMKDYQPKASYHVEWKKKFVPDWMSRVPTQIAETIVGENKIAVQLSALERMIVGRTHTPRLTDIQREKLTSPIYYIPASPNGEGGIYLDSPVKMYDSSTLFKQFADEKINAMVTMGAPNSKVVNALCAYEHPNGWLVFKDKNISKVVKPEVRTYEINLGYTPSIKKVDNG